MTESKFRKLIDDHLNDLGIAKCPSCEGAKVSFNKPMLLWSEDKTACYPYVPITCSHCGHARLFDLRAIIRDKDEIKKILKGLS